jgi:hypothetical protein
MKDTMNSIKKVTFSKQTRSFLQFNIFDLQMTTMLMALFPSLSLSLSFSLSLSLSFSLIMQSALTTSTTTATKRIAPARLPCTVYRSARTLPPVPMLRFAVFEMPELQFVKSVAFLTGAWCTGETHDRPWHGLVSCWTRKRAQTVGRARLAAGTDSMWTTNLPQVVAAVERNDLRSIVSRQSGSHCSLARSVGSVTHTLLVVYRAFCHNNANQDLCAPHRGAQRRVSSQMAKTTTSKSTSR